MDALTFLTSTQGRLARKPFALGVLAGPLNYVGVNPTVTDCNLPQPS